MDQAKLNADYQKTLNQVFGGTISLRDKYLNPNAVINHHCKICMNNFYSRPLWLVNKQQLHECVLAPANKVTPPKNKTIKKVNYSCKVNEKMRLEMILLYRQGGSLKSIAKRFELSPPTVKKHILKAGVKLRS